MYRLRYYMYRNRYVLRRMYNWLVCGLIFFALLLVLSFQPVRQGFCDFVGIVTETGADLAFRCSERDPRGLLRAAIPSLAWSGSTEDIPELVTPGSILSALLAPFRVKAGSPLELVQREIAMLEDYNPEIPAVKVEPPPEIKEDSSSRPPLSDQALIGIYHTHTGETYNLTDGTDRVTGRGGVVDVGEALKKELEEKYGIKVAHSTTVNDVNYNAAYAESEKDARTLLAENPGIQILLDIHRDAGKSRQNSLVKINGQDCGIIMLVVGSGARAPFPTWKQNYNFAMELAGMMDKKYPGLCCGVRVKEGRYNQFLHPRAVLLEVGSTSNSTGEAVNSIRLLAGLLAEKSKEIAPDAQKNSAGQEPEAEYEPD
ncbi:stage II sporulation protein P [Desulfocucumis palustris]|uniref:Stage II sporulation protein P n=1 Tax=Desulfocucumis palustris TaxID=1898651 RepID=A0A2L2XAQ5_9FIRM|nr:stage II sporulation protein P [Desulfocucumis palustris]GBF33152.1 stage II sporulation protein P [Desulfocucumis palustris]